MEDLVVKQQITGKAVSRINMTFLTSGNPTTGRILPNNSFQLSFLRKDQSIKPLITAATLTTWVSQVYFQLILSQTRINMEL